MVRHCQDVMPQPPPAAERNGSIPASARRNRFVFPLTPRSGGSTFLWDRERPLWVLGRNSYDPSKETRGVHSNFFPSIGAYSYSLWSLGLTRFPLVLRSVDHFRSVSKTCARGAACPQVPTAQTQTNSRPCLCQNDGPRIHQPAQKQTMPSKMGFPDQPIRMCQKQVITSK